MSFDISGFSSPVEKQTITLEVSEKHPLVKLANTLPWEEMLALILPDLQKTSKFKWWLGRKLAIRTHLGAYLLQKQFDFTDRQTEQLIRDNAVYQVFCGYGIVERFSVPDHTKIEDFRSRLEPETQRQLANLMAKVAVQHQYANPKELDIDSTPQNANISYPSRPSLLVKIVKLAKKLSEPLIKLCGKSKEDYPISLSYFNQLSLYYYALKRKGNTEVAQKMLCRLWQDSYAAVLPVLKDSYLLLTAKAQRKLGTMANRIREAVETLQWRAAHVLDTTYAQLFEGADSSYNQNRISSLHAREIACINKNKLSGKIYYGRVYQLGRIGGNFLILQKSTSLHMPDAQSLPGMVIEHQRCFGEGTLESVATDRGYYSLDNFNLLTKLGVKEIGLQRPNRTLNAPEETIDNETQRKLYCRRSGIEALIGHTKQGGQLDRSRMKSDRTTLSAGYASVMGFNLRQLTRYATGLVYPKTGECINSLQNTLEMDNYEPLAA